ncbi:hypothetical protein YYC_04782 [Plasmodium yoelii 17X]|uniref:Uncharacterized protein n=1 Tax=Plasmodium yoelii 17X TaxID=1323249 RepID=V7PED6_PLAYE|nr:hypothetical protein YYC_04782 [Plasmodium yoelii 17X]
MDDTLCGKFDYLRKHISDELNKQAEIELEKISNFEKYCSNKDCKSELEKITIGFLWLLGECYSISKNRKYKENNTNVFFLYMISWFSYQLNQSTKHSTTKINDFYTNHVINSHKYDNFTNNAYRFTELKEFIEERKDLLNINIEDLSKFYDAFKLLCIMYGNVAQNQKGDILSNNANDFVKKYIELNNKYNNGAPHNQILSALSTDYNNLKDECKNCSSLPEIETSISAFTSGDKSSSSSIGNRLFTVLSIFGAIAFFLGISYKVNNKELKNYFHYIYANVNKKIVHFLTFYISIHYLDFESDLKNNK